MVELAALRRVCLITPAHLATNPRLVKEADALVEAGYQVQVYACQYMDWATRADQAILRRATWQTSLLGWMSDRQPYLFWKSRFRQHLCYRLLQLHRLGDLGDGAEKVALRAYDRVLPELRKRVLRHPADLYIAHNLQALPVAVAAARVHGAQVGFDAEDLHTGMRRFGSVPSVRDTITAYIERRYLPACIYVTAASPAIVDAYATTYGLAKPTPVLNVFPLSQRPAAFRPSAPHRPLRLYWFSQTIGTQRGLEDVVRAMGNLRDPHIELHLRGVWQAGYRERLLALAISSGVKAQQLVAHAPQPPDEMIRLAAQYDVGLALEQPVSENRDTCLTNKIFTYLLAGNAVLATDTKGQSAVCKTIGVAGCCYQPGNVDALTRHLQRWQQDRGALQAARRQAWDWGTRKYNWDREKHKFLHVIENSFVAAAQ